MALKTYAHEENRWVFAVFNVTFTDIKWTCKNSRLFLYKFNEILLFVGWSSVVGVATDYELDGKVIASWWGE